MKRGLAAACAVLCLALAAAPPVTAKEEAPTSWDNLVKVPSKKLDAVYLAPGASFSEYNKILLDPTEVAFQKNWLRDYNRSTSTLSQRITDAEAQKALERVRTGFQDIFVKAYTEAGYQVVTEPGPDVLRLRTAVINLRVNAPDKMTAGRSRSYAPEAGSATLVLEARDSESGAILGRAVDARIAGDMGPYMNMRSSVSNRADFEQLFKAWAKASVNGLNVLKAGSPVAGLAQSGGR